MIRNATPWLGRRALLLSASGALLVASRDAHAQARQATPRQTEGPFYPRDWSGDADNDLVAVQGAAARAQGQVVHLEGRVLALDGTPLAGAAVEIWQCDALGVYRHPRDESAARRRDQGFQGRGRAVADATGNYRFRTIRPVPYPGRTPHIHFKVRHQSRGDLITQMYVAGEPQNERDSLLNSISDPRLRDSLLVRFEPADRLEQGALAGRFDIVLA
jgi:protocatechuate 3,4-dioxygenase, beta subunit